MRTKEINQALELLDKIKISESMNVYIGVKDVKKVNTLIQYIEELEKLPNKIRDKIKELEYKTLYINGITNKTQTQLASTGFIMGKIQVLNELLEEK